MKKLITLYPIPISEEVRVSVGLMLSDGNGNFIRGDVTWRDYDRQAALTNGTIGILRKYHCGTTNKSIYWLEVREAA